MASNVATSAGAALFQDVKVLMDRCTFSANVATSGPGGAIITRGVGGGTMTVNTTSFTHNRAVGAGGAVLVEDVISSRRLAHCEFRHNAAVVAGAPALAAAVDGERGGGGLAVWGAADASQRLDVHACVFDGNTASTNAKGGPGVPVVGGMGGALLLSRTAAVVTDCVLTGNLADFGGGIAETLPSNPTHAGSSLVLRGSTVTANHANGGGGGVLWHAHEPQFSTGAPNTVADNTAL